MEVLFMSSSKKITESTIYDNRGNPTEAVDVSLDRDILGWALVTT